MTKHERLLAAILLVLFLASLARAQNPCPPNDWCAIYLGPAQPSNGYNAPIFSHDLGKTILATTNSLMPNVSANGPEATGFSTYTTRTTTLGSSPWVTLTDCGCTATNEIRQMMFTLEESITSSATSLLVDIGQTGNGTLNKQNTWPQSGCAFVGDEAVCYSGCDTMQPNFIAGSCTTGATLLSLNNLQRGMRIAGGFLPASPHTGGTGGRSGIGEEVNLLCPNGIHPPAMHTVNIPHLEGTKLVEDGGSFQENWTFAGRYELDLVNLSAGWKYVPVYSNNGWFPLGYQEGSTTYDPDTNSAIYVGGLHGGPTADVYVKWYGGAVQPYGVNGITNDWIKVIPHGGSPGKRDGLRSGWDSVNHVTVWMGGANSSLNLNIGTRSVATYNSRTGDWCNSETTVGTNAPSCNLPPMSGSPPPDNVVANKWPAWTYNPTRRQWAFTDNQHVWLYDVAANSWALTPAGPSPCPAPLQNQWNGRGWVYDDIAQTYILVEHRAGLCQLPDSVLGGPLTLTIPNECLHTQVGALYVCQLEATGGQPPYIFSETGTLPGGLTFTPSTGVISGRPTQNGPFPIIATVKDSHP